MRIIKYINNYYNNLKMVISYDRKMKLKYNEYMKNKEKITPSDNILNVLSLNT